MKRKRNIRRTRGFVEQLENRRVMAASPNIIGVEINAAMTDPADLSSGPQPTSWAEQRSDIRSIDVIFDNEAEFSASDFVLKNLGVDHSDPDTTITIDPAQVVDLGSTARITFDAYDLPDGSYELTVKDTVTDIAGNAIDGDGDGTRGGDFVYRDNGDNKFRKIAADFNGDGGVSTFDNATISYWFAQSGFPEYVDLNEDGSITIFDFAILAGNFGDSITSPPNVAPEAHSDSFFVDSGQVETFDVIGSAVTDLNLDDLTISSASATTGIVTIVNNEIQYDPDGQFTQDGSDTITYTVNDGNGGSDTGTLVAMVQAPAADNGDLRLDLLVDANHPQTVDSEEGGQDGTWTYQFIDEDSGNVDELVRDVYVQFDFRPHSGGISAGDLVDQTVTLTDPEGHTPTRSVRIGAGGTANVRWLIKAKTKSFTIAWPPAVNTDADEVGNKAKVELESVSTNANGTGNAFGLGIGTPNTGFMIIHENGQLP